MSEQIFLYYGHDPMCSFCWAFRPCWETIKKKLSVEAPKIEIVYLAGGLAPDSTQPMPLEMRNKLIQTWRYIENRIPGTQFNFDFWTEQQPRRSTYPACRAVYAAKSLSALKEYDMILAIQQAYYQNAQNPSDDDTLIQCAGSIGLDQNQFCQTYYSETTEHGFLKQMKFAREKGIVSFPSIVLSKHSQHHNIAIDYIDADSVLNSIRNTLENL